MAPSPQFWSRVARALGRRVGFPKQLRGMGRVRGQRCWGRRGEWDPVGVSTGPPLGAQTSIQDQEGRSGRWPLGAEAVPPGAPSAWGRRGSRGSRRWPSGRGVRSQRDPAEIPGRGLHAAPGPPHGSGSPRRGRGATCVCARAPLPPGPRSRTPTARPPPTPCPARAAPGLTQAPFPFLLCPRAKASSGDHGGPRAPTIAQCHWAQHAHLGEMARAVH